MGIKTCPSCGAALPQGSNTTMIITVGVIGTILVIAVLVFRLVIGQAKAVTEADQAQPSGEVVMAYEKAAAALKPKISGRETAPFASSQVQYLGYGQYRVDVPWEGFDVNGHPATKISTCRVHCDRGLCYVDSVELQ